MVPRHSLLLLACCLAAAAAVRAAADAQPEVCDGDGWDAIELSKGEVADAEDPATAAAKQLADAIAAEVHMDEGCKVSKRVRVEAACSRPVEQGDDLGGGEAAATGTLYDMQIVERIVCPDGHFKVRYEARGVMPEDETKLVGTQTRLIDVFASSYQSS